MSDEPTRREGRLTSDPETVREWTREADAVAVRDTGGRVRIVPEHEAQQYGERIEWDEFDRELSDSDYVVVRREGAPAEREFEVVERDEAVSRAAVESDEVEEALLAGETVTSEITETVVVERTIVEHATVESEVVDREVVDERVVDAELLSRSVLGCEFTASPDVAERDRFFADWADTAAVATRRTDAATTRTTEETTTAAETEPEATFEDEVAVTVDENWAVTKDVLERVTVESRVVDVDTEQTDTIESDTLEETIDVEGVQRTVLTSDLLESEDAAEDVIRSGQIESRWAEEGAVVETVLAERRTVEEEVSRQLRLRGRLDERTVESAEFLESTVLESAIVEEGDTLDAVSPVAETTTGEGVVDEGVVETTDDEVADEEVVTGMEAEGAGGVEEAEVRVTPTDRDVGKDVVDPEGEEIGMVSAVEGDTFYVDPHPTLTDRIKAALEWEDIDEDAYPLGPENVLRITDDEVQVDVDVEPAT